MKIASAKLTALAVLSVGYAVQAQSTDAYWQNGSGNEGFHISNPEIYNLPANANMSEYHVIFDAFKAPLSQNFLLGPKGDFTVSSFTIADNWTDKVPDQYNKGNFWVGDSGGKIHVLNDMTINSSWYLRNTNGTENLVEIQVDKNFILENKWNSSDTLTVMWGDTGYGYGMINMGPKSLSVGEDAVIRGNVYWTMYLPNFGPAWRASNAPVKISGVVRMGPNKSGAPQWILNNNENRAARHMYVSLGGLDGSGEIYNRAAVAHDPGGSSKTTLVFTNGEGVAADFQGGLASNRFYANANSTTSQNKAELNVIMNGKGEQTLRTDLLVNGQTDKAPWVGDILVNSGTLRIGLNYSAANPEKDFSRLNVIVNEYGNFGAAAVKKPEDKSEDIGATTVASLELDGGGIVVTSHKALGNSTVHVYETVAVSGGFKIYVNGFGEQGTALKKIISWEKARDSENRAAIAEALESKQVKLFVNGKERAIAETNIKNTDEPFLTLTVEK